MRPAVKETVAVSDGAVRRDGGASSRPLAGLMEHGYLWLRGTETRSFHATRGDSTASLAAGGGWGWLLDLPGGHAFRGGAVDGFLAPAAVRRGLDLPVAAFPDHDQRPCGHTSGCVGGQGKGQSHEDLVGAADLDFVSLDGDGCGCGAVPVGLDVGDHAIPVRAICQEGPGDLGELLVGGHPLEVVRRRDHGSGGGVGEAPGDAGADTWSDVVDVRNGQLWGDGDRLASQRAAWCALVVCGYRTVAGVSVGGGLRGGRIRLAGAAGGSPCAPGQGEGEERREANGGDAGSSCLEQSHCCFPFLKRGGRSVVASPGQAGGSCPSWVRSGSRSDRPHGWRRLGWRHWGGRGSDLASYRSPQFISVLHVTDGVLEVHR